MLNKIYKNRDKFSRTKDYFFFKHYFDKNTLIDNHQFISNSPTSKIQKYCKFISKRLIALVFLI